MLGQNSLSFYENFWNTDSPRPGGKRRCVWTTSKFVSTVFPSFKVFRLGWKTTRASSACGRRQENVVVDVYDVESTFVTLLRRRRRVGRGRQDKALAWESLEVVLEVGRLLHFKRLPLKCCSWMCFHNIGFEYCLDKPTTKTFIALYFTSLLPYIIMYSFIRCFQQY